MRSTHRFRSTECALTLMVIGLVILGLIGCSSTKNPARAAAPDQSIGIVAAGNTNAPWEVEWKKTVAAAKQEGEVALSGPPGEGWRRVLVSFEQDFPGIRVQYTGLNSRDFWPRLQRERELGQYLWDLRVGGPDPQVYEARDRGVLDPVRPLLLLPEVADESKWAGGFKGLFNDKEQKYVPGFLAFLSSVVLVNRDVVPEAEFRSDADLLDPRWKGRIVLQDPRGGSGLGSMTILLAVHGETFVRDLLSRQNIVVTSDVRQQAEWVVRGRYPIGMGVLPDQLLHFKEQGLKFNVKRLKLGAVGLSAGFGGIQLMNRIPHPNAAKVYINWLLRQQSQKRLTQALETNSRRVDVPPGDLESAVDPKRIEDYIPHQFETMLSVRQRALELAMKLLQ